MLFRTLVTIHSNPMKSILLTRFLPVLALVLALHGLAAAQAPPEPIGGPSPLAPAGVPIDGGASLLLAGGVAYGLKKLRSRRALR